MNQLIILSGPSCVGKSPLDKALQRFEPELYRNLKKLCLYNSRSPRSGELDGVDYYFRSKAEIEKLKSKSDFVVLEVRGDLQALDINEVETILKSSNAFFEGNPFVGKALLIEPKLKMIPKISAFMSPISKEEVQALQKEPNIDIQSIVTEIMRRKLLRRTKKQKTNLSLKDLENIEKRCGSAYHELKQAASFDYVIPNHDGEDSDNWDAFYYLFGDAKKAFEAFVDVIYNKENNYLEDWNGLNL